jgi:hypothetical protein
VYSAEEFEVIGSSGYVIMLSEIGGGKACIYRCCGTIVLALLTTPLLILTKVDREIEMLWER